jgi:hypothetical protein
MGARWYDPALGRWISPDTIVPDSKNPQNLNRYLYVNNNPVRYTDPTGHCIFGLDTLVCMIIAGLLGAGVGYATYTAVDVAQTPAIAAPRVDSPTSTDMTPWLINQMKANTPAAEVIRQNLDTGLGIYEIAGLKQWKALVESGAIWDFKDDIKNANVMQNDNVILGGREINYQAIANIHFGYVGRAAGMVNIVLEGGAGVAQLATWVTKDLSKVGPLVTNFDQPFDNWSIRFGIFLYDKYGQNPDALTPDALANAFDEFIKNNPPPEPDK